MRWLIGLLLLANFSVYLWGSLRLQASPHSRVPPPEIGSIGLVVGGKPEILPRSPQPPSDEFRSRLTELLNRRPDNWIPDPGDITCGELTWLESADTAAELAEMLQQLGFEAAPEPVARRERDGYWVLVPPLGDRKSARAVLKRLQDNGIEDTWLMPKGSFQNAISLGLYAGRTLAQRRADSISALGFDVEVRENYNLKPAFRVHYISDSHGAESIASALAAKPGLAHDNISCQ